MSGKPGMSAGKAKWELVRQLDGRWRLYAARGTMTCYGTFNDVGAAQWAVKHRRSDESVFLDEAGELAADPYKDAR